MTTFENLGRLVLKTICSHINCQDMLNLCGTSKKLHEIILFKKNYFWTNVDLTNKKVSWEGVKIFFAKHALNNQVRELILKDTHLVWRYSLGRIPLSKIIGFFHKIETIDLRLYNSYTNVYFIPNIVCKTIKNIIFYIGKYGCIRDWYQTPLYFACSSGFSKMVKYILEESSKDPEFDINRGHVTYNAYGYAKYGSPLMCAVQYKYLEIVEILLKFGADPTHEILGFIAIEEAKKMKLKEIEEAKRMNLIAIIDAMEKWIKTNVS